MFVSRREGRNKGRNKKLFSRAGGGQDCSEGGNRGKHSGEIGLTVESRKSLTGLSGMIGVRAVRIGEDRLEHFAGELIAAG